MHKAICDRCGSTADLRHAPKADPHEWFLPTEWTTLHGVFSDHYEFDLCGRCVDVLRRALFLDQVPQVEP